eukprot:7760747-Pyramimonas_sp.AAC.1
MVLSCGTPSQSKYTARSRVGVRNLFRRPALDIQESRSRSGLSHDVLSNRAIARDFLVISCKTHASATRL